MDDSKFLITGGNGQLGLALQRRYPNAKATDVAKLDITDWESVSKFDWSNITHILNAAAFTNVDGAESPESRAAAWKVNAIGTANLSRIALQKDITIVHISTEYVFDGTKNPHTEDEPPSPLSVYGASKAAGDVAVSMAPKHYLIRTSWVVGEGKNFVRTMTNLGQKGVSPSVVSDQIGRLTFADELQRCITFLLENQPAYGTYNFTNGGDPASWADITREIFKLAGFQLNVTDTTTADYFADKPGSAKRPLNSVLDLTKIQSAGLELKDWHDSLEEYIKKEMENSK
jgi:dTDP-4-dehydrorhamnose 3,5-epimerase